MISISESAQLKIKENLQKRGRGLGIRIGVKTTGCSGLAYTLEFADKFQLNDLIFDFENIKVFIDQKSSVYFEDLYLDYIKKGLNEGFEFSNKAEKGRCGCGESFRV